MSCGIACVALVHKKNAVCSPLEPMESLTLVTTDLWETARKMRLLADTSSQSQKEPSVWTSIRFGVQLLLIQRFAIRTTYLLNFQTIFSCSSSSNQHLFCRSVVFLLPKNDFSKSSVSVRIRIRLIFNRDVRGSGFVVVKQDLSVPNEIILVI